MMACRKCSRFEQRILHTSYLLLHGFERLTDYRRAHFSRAQIAYFLNLQQIKKGIALGGGYQSGLFPSCQLTRREPQNANQIRSIVSIHGSKGTLLRIIGKVNQCRNSKVVPGGIFEGNFARQMVQVRWKSCWRQLSLVVGRRTSAKNAESGTK